MPFLVILILGSCFSVAFGGGLKFVCSWGFEKTLENWSFRALAFLVADLIGRLFTIKSLMPKCSLRCHAGQTVEQGKHVDNPKMLSQR